MSYTSGNQSNFATRLHELGYGSGVLNSFTSEGQSYIQAGKVTYQDSGKWEAEADRIAYTVSGITTTTAFNYNPPMSLPMPYQVTIASVTQVSTPNDVTIQLDQSYKTSSWYQNDGNKMVSLFVNYGGPNTGIISTANINDFDGSEIILDNTKTIALLQIWAYGDGVNFQTGPTIGGDNQGDNSYEYDY